MTNQSVMTGLQPQQRAGEASKGMPLLQLFAAWMLLGAVLGGILGYMLTMRVYADISSAGAIMSAFGFTAVGATMGMLVAGAIDTVIKGSLEEDYDTGAE